ncbi:hypothetical protein F444_18552 [Phytophthora nicotianae P1976]|uniref:ZSWIM1/3 RNaseH-like domain-containing protein n=1 Tax=Phytophthora nicotianae P1976 TaxID=1317066 RepID=A0A080ZB02_PHYNI|nr:hypothetical protein F444_18552 [Phytophthora nicotianae P1976]
MQNFRACDCKAQFVATLKRIKIAKNQFGFAVYVTKQYTTHTHPLNEDVWRAYTKNRRVMDPKILELVRQFVAVDSKFGKIHRYVIDNSVKGVTSRDVRSMIRSIQNEVKVESVDERVRHMLDDFNKADPGSVAQRCVNDGNVATCLTFQTVGMRKIFVLFPEILLIDVTHKTNDLRYKLFSFMVMDAYGKGQFVQHAFVDQETSENMENAIEAFQANNSDWSQVEVIMVD